MNRQQRRAETKNKPMERLSIDDVPDDVQYVWAMQMTNHAMGAKAHERVSEIIQQNPRWFPWEHKYARIPKEVHEAHYAEMVAYYGKKMLDMIKNDEPVPPESSYDPAAFDAFGFFEEINNLWKQEQEEKRQHERDLRAIWNKHYKPYKLEYRG